MDPSSQRHPVPADTDPFDRLLEQLLDQPAPTRGAWLSGRSDVAPALRARLERLLRADAWAAGRGIFDALPRLYGAPLQCDAASDAGGFAPGDRVGPYVLQRAIGWGGMGSVWLATFADGHLQRRVALKLPHRQQQPQAQLARFERERDALAALEHPGIARLYDAGTDAAGHLYLAMEYVEGEPIDRWCDARALDIDARIALVLQVADAVHFAHCALVVHRDLKPGNILVDARGRVRLLDFGIAKLLEPGAGTDATPTETLTALTPAYAAPEQFSHGRVTTATDVYALGILLHRLLCGSSPYRTRRDTRAAHEEAVLAGDLVPPSRSAIGDADARARSTTTRRLRRRLAGELDTIVATALRFAPPERYASADALA